LRKEHVMRKLLVAFAFTLAVITGAATAFIVTATPAIADCCNRE
jgi:hypothetical protein